MTNTEIGGWPRHLIELISGFVIAYLCVYGIAAAITDGTGELELRLRTTGGLLELLGIATVALGISRLRREFELPSTFAEIADELFQWLSMAWQWLISPIRKKQVPGVVTGVGTGAAGFSTMTARGVVRPGKASPVSDKVEWLYQAVDDLDRRYSELQQTLEQEGEHRERAFEEERKARGAALGELADQIRTLAVGGIRLQTIGVIWLLFGVILANWSRDLELLLL